MAINRTSPKKGKVVDIPTVPTVGTATAGGELATVAFTAATVGGPVTTFTALSNPGSVTGTGTSPITVSGLTAGTAYTFTVRGTNATGSSEYSSASNSITALAGSAFESIATQTVGSGGSSSITFSSIPSTYKHLQLRVIYRNTVGVSNLRMQYNGDTASNYITHHLYGDGTSAGAFSNGVNSYMYLGNGRAATSVFTGFIIDVLDYTSTTKNKTTKTLMGYDTNGAASQSIELMSGLWFATPAAVTSITFVPGTDQFAQYSSFALYGVKG